MHSSTQTVCYTSELFEISEEIMDIANEPHFRPSLTIRQQNPPREMCLKNIGKSHASAPTTTRACKTRSAPDQEGVNAEVPQQQSKPKRSKTEG